MLTLVSNQEWVFLSNENNHEILHRDYGNGIHGLVFVDQDGGNSFLMDGDDNIIDSHSSSITCFNFLKDMCDHLRTSNIAV